MTSHRHAPLGIFAHMTRDRKAKKPPQPSRSRRRSEAGPGLDLNRGGDEALRPAQPARSRRSPRPADRGDRDHKALLKRVQTRIRAKRMSVRTEETYLRWIRRYVAFHGQKHPAALGRADIERFVSHLATELNLGPQSQNQAASAIVFLYRELFGQEFGGRNGVVRAQEPEVLPRYASPEEVARTLARLDGIPRVAAMLMYGSGTRISETLSLRLKDLSLGTRELSVRGGKGGKDRTTVIAEATVEVLQAQVENVEELHARDRENGGGWAPLPNAMHRKDPRAGWDLGWQYLFPSPKTSVDEKTGHTGRRHLHASVVQRAVKRASRAAKVTRPITSHVLRHCFATEMLRSGVNVRLLQRLMGHRDLKTTARYLHILERPGIGLVSPLDRLPTNVEA